MNKDDFAAQLREAYLQEAQEQLQNLVAGLLQLEEGKQSAPDKALVEQMFREVHNLKGSARVAGFPQTESICQSLESVFSLMKSGSLLLKSAQLDVVHRAINLVEKVTFDPPGSVEQALVVAMTEELDSLVKARDVQGQDTDLEAEAFFESEPAKPIEIGGLVSDRAASAGTIRISLDSLDGLVSQAEEFLGFRAISKQFALEVSDVCELLDDLEYAVERNSAAAQSIVSAANAFAREAQDVPLGANAETLRGRASEAFGLQQDSLSKVHLVKHRLLEIQKQVAEQVRSTNLLVDRFLYDTKQLMMIPCSNLLDIFPRMVRALSRDLGKDVDLQLSGADIVLDKRVIGQLKDPLTHLIRNAIDHGIEAPAVRAKLGKPEKSILTLRISQLDAATVEIVLSDDGGGIDEETVKASALKQGLLGQAESEALSHEQAISLIFMSSLSTSKFITDISGRGLGLAIVKDTIVGFGGKISVKSELRKGTEFRLTVPVSLASFRGLFLESCGQMFVIPTTNFERILRLQQGDIRLMAQQEAILFNEKLIPLVHLSDLLELDSRNSGADVFMNVAVISHNEEYLPVVVDKILDEQEVLVKRLSAPMEKVRNVAGLTVLGSGKIVPVLSVPDLIASSRGRSSAARAALPAKKERQVLVVDDTLTARLLIKNILSSSGFLVQTADDGFEALEALKQTHFDLVLTDIEMPKMNGFQLTEAIRKDEALLDIPIIIVTALATKEDRERGVECGANAYFVKTSFDQSNLLDVVSKLI